MTQAKVKHTIWPFSVCVVNFSQKFNVYNHYIGICMRISRKCETIPTFLKKITLFWLRATTQSQHTLTAGTRFSTGRSVCVCYDCVLTCLIPVTLGRSCKQDGATWGSLLGKYNFISLVTQFKWVKSPELHKNLIISNSCSRAHCFFYFLKFLFADV